MTKQALGTTSIIVTSVITLTINFFLFSCAVPHHTPHPIPLPTTITPTSIPPTIPRLLSTTQAPTALPTHTSTFTATTSPPRNSTATLTPTFINSKTPTAVGTCISVKPIATTPMLWAANASPDGQWVAYWAASQEAITQTVDNWPTGVLHLINLQTGKTCMRAEITTEAIKPALAWSVNDQITITTTEGTYTGLPCQPESFDQASQEVIKVVSASPTPFPSYSSDGKYRIKTDELSNENDILKYETSIITVDSGEVVQRVTWFIDARTTGPGDYPLFLGGEWLSRSQFLIYETIDQGPLILDARKGAIVVLTDLLRMQIPPSPLKGGLFTLRAIPLPGSEPDRYHLLVVGGSGGPSDFPDAILYHSENGVVETLPYRIPWYGGFSPDRQWLMMDKQPDVNGHEAHEVWIRPLEDTHAGWQLLAGPGEVEYGALWNSSNTEIVINHEDRITWQPFPNPYRVRLGCWSTINYWTNPEFLSQDGCFALTTGNQPGEQDYGLFVLDRCQPIPTPPPVPTQTQEFLSLVDAQSAARFTLFTPSFVTEGLILKKVTVMEYPDGSQTVQLAYAQDFTGEIPDANQKLLFVSLTKGGSPVTLDSLTSIFRESVMDIHAVTVRGQAGFTYWEPSAAAGNSAWLAWNEGDLTITIALYGDWPQPTEADPHAQDNVLLQIAESLSKN